jgi:hypothetical protein
MENQMERNRAPEVPIAGIIYGRIAYWLAMAGVLIAAVGSVIYLIGGGYLDQKSLLQNLWRGHTAQTTWENLTGTAGIPHGFWYIERLGQGDCLAMLGIAIVCIAGVVAMWGVVFEQVRHKGGIYIIFAAVVAVILTLSASGLITVL